MRHSIFGHVGRAYEEISLRTSSLHENKEDAKETERLRRLIMEDFTTFLLNNILMTVQFFENYDRDVKKIRETCFNESALGSDQFKLFKADSLHKLVGTKVIFLRKTTPPKEGSSELPKEKTKETKEHIHPFRNYITYQGVELGNASSGAKIKPHNMQYKLVVQQCEEDRKEDAGYVKLVATEALDDRHILDSPNLIEHPDSKSLVDPTRPVLQSNAFVAKNDNFYCLDPVKRTQPYPLKIYKMGQWRDSPCSIPRCCFKESENQILANNQRRIGILRVKDVKSKISHRLLMSAAFKRHFAECFHSSLAHQMGFDKMNWESTTFHYDRVKVKQNYALHHIFPVLELNEWPRGATDFDDDRDDEVVIKQKDWMAWPTKRMQEEIKRSGCCLLPVGYNEASDDSACEYILEWKIIFPKAEKYLMLHLMHAHVRCYLFAVILHKTFIETELNSIHFDSGHLATLLFHMVRKDFLAWPECRQGETLLKYLRVLHGTLQKRGLKSFFLPKRDTYANCPLRVIHRVQTFIMRFIENPIPYILKALVNLKFQAGFYPVFDYLKLYNVLTVENLKEYLNPSPPKKVKGRKVQPEPKPIGRDFIDVEKILKERNTPLVRETVLRLFINHFIDVANHGRTFEAFEQSMLYLSHARRLTLVLSEEFNRQEAEEMLWRIENAMTKCQKRLSVPDSWSGQEKSSRQKAGISNGWTVGPIAEEDSGETLFDERLPPSLLSRRGGYHTVTKV